MPDDRVKPPVKRATTGSHQLPPERQSEIARDTEKATLREAPPSGDKVTDKRLIALGSLGIIAAGAALTWAGKDRLKAFAKSLKEALPKPAGPRPK